MSWDDSEGCVRRPARVMSPDPVRPARTIAAVACIACIVGASCTTFGEAARMADALDLAVQAGGRPGSELRSPFEGGSVLEVGGPRDDGALLGPWVVIRYEIGLAVGDRLVPETEAYLLIAGIDPLFVALGESVELDEPIGTVPASGRCLVLLASRDAASATLAAASGGACVPRGELWYWDASFVARP